ncbi:MAG: PD-(D/E)XK nuclease family protein [Myxococcales bacterium]
MNDEPWTGRVARALLAGKEEDRFTAFLEQLLKSELVLAAFLKEVCGIPSVAFSTGDLTVATQVQIPNGRPDLVITGPNIFLVFEAKVSAWLHKDQLVSYAQAQSKWRVARPEGIAKLFIVAPQSGLVGLTATSRDQIGAIATPEFFAAVSWEAIAGLFKTVQAGIRNEELRTSLLLFVQLVETRLGEMSEPFSGEEERLLADPLTGRSIGRVLEVLQRVSGKLSSREPRIKQTAASGMTWQGYTLRYDERWWWLGLWPPVWRQTGVSPLILQTPGIKPTEVAFWDSELPKPVPYKTDHEGMAVPLPMAAGEDFDLVATGIVNIVVAYIVNRPTSGGAKGSTLTQPMPPGVQ